MTRDAVQATSVCGRCISWLSAPREILVLMTGYSENVLVFGSKTDVRAQRAVSPAFSQWVGRWWSARPTATSRCCLQLPRVSVLTSTS